MSRNRRGSVRGFDPVKQKTGYKVLYVEVVRGRRLHENKSKCNPYCVVTYDGFEISTPIRKSDVNPSWQSQHFVFRVKNTNSTVYITLMNRHQMKRDSFLGVYTLSIRDLIHEDVKNKWYKLKGMKNSPNIKYGQILLKIQFCATDKGKMHKLHDLIGVDYYLSLHEFFARLPTNHFCLLFDNNKLVPSAKEINSITNVILSTPEIHTSKILRFVITSEVNVCERSATLFRRNSLASKVTTSCLNRFGKKYLTGLISGILAEISERDENLEVDPHKAPKGSNVIDNMNAILEYCSIILENITNSIKTMPFEIREVCAILAESVEKKFETKEIARLAVGGIIFLRFICPAITSPVLFGMITKQPGRNASRTFILITKILQNLANGVLFEKKEKFMKSSNTFLKKKLPVVNNLLLDIVNLKNCKPKSTLDKPKAVSLKKILRVSVEDLERMYSFYNIHLYFQTNLEQIRAGFEEREVPVSLPFVEEERRTLLDEIDQLKEIVKELGEPVPIVIKQTHEIEKKRKKSSRKFDL